MPKLCSPRPRRGSLSTLHSQTLSYTLSLKVVEFPLSNSPRLPCTTRVDISNFSPRRLDTVAVLCRGKWCRSAQNLLHKSRLECSPSKRLLRNGTTAIQLPSLVGGLLDSCVPPAFSEKAVPALQMHWPSVRARSTCELHTCELHRTQRVASQHAMPTGPLPADIRENGASSEGFGSRTVRKSRFRWPPAARRNGPGPRSWMCNRTDGGDV